MFRDERKNVERKVLRQEHERLQIDEALAPSSYSEIAIRPFGYSPFIVHDVGQSSDDTDPLRLIYSPKNDLAGPSFLNYIFSKPAVNAEISIHCLPKTFELSKGDDALSAAISAVGLASTATSLAPCEDLVRAKKRYVEAIQMTQAAIEKCDDGKVTHKLVLITILLSMFEVIVSQVDNTSSDHIYAKHLQGAGALLGTIMDEFHVKDRTALSLMLQIRTRLV